jgi:hypothetical protein
MIRDVPDPEIRIFLHPRYRIRIPDAGGKKALAPGSATLLLARIMPIYR